MYICLFEQAGVVPGEIRQAAGLCFTNTPPHFFTSFSTHTQSSLSFSTQSSLALHPHISSLSLSLHPHSRLSLFSPCLSRRSGLSGLSSAHLSHLRFGFQVRAWFEGSML